MSPRNLLQELSIRSVPNSVWFRLEICIQQCLFPSRYHRSIRLFQNRSRAYFRYRMERQAEFTDMFKRQNRYKFLVPSNCDVFSNPINWTLALARGDHFAVFTGDVFHHGIYIGGGRAVHVVVDARPALRECPLADFGDSARGPGSRGGSERGFCIVRHPVPSTVTEEDYREATVQFALYCLEHLAQSEFRDYDLIENNCECFVWYVFTGGAGKYSEQAHKTLMLLLSDAKKAPQDGLSPAHIAIVGLSSRHISRRCVIA
jgi:hypothetical protein